MAQEDDKLFIELMADFAEIAATYIENYGFDRPETNGSHEVLIQFFSYQHRLITQTERLIHKPLSFACPSEYQNALNSLEQKISNGANLFPYQSRKILKIDYNDPLLNDWGIQHLHLGTEMELNRPLIKGTSDVLFVFFNATNAYLIKIADHTNWTEQEMIRILHDNFPEAIESWRIKDASALSFIPSNEDIKKLRKANVNSGLEIYPGVIYLGPGGGLTSNGKSANVILAANKYSRFAKRTEKLFKEKEESIREKILKTMGVVPEILRFKLVLDDSEFVIKETNSGLEFLRILTTSI